MKIDNIPYVSSSLTKPRTGLDDSFEGCITQNRSPFFLAQDDTDYFQLHQNELEQSDLSFHTITTQSKPTLIPNLLMSDSSVREHSSLPPQSTAQVITAPDSHPILSPQQPNTSLKIVGNAQPFIPLEKGHEDNTIFFEPPVNHKEALPKTHQPTHVKPVLTTALTAQKPYQLFIDDHAVELALNTTHLSLPITRDWYQTIKQWLYTKGYSLKQLIINGVKQ